jgi:hypothetical protein
VTELHAETNANISLTKAPKRRGPGAPSSAIPELASFGFLVMIAPFFYAFYGWVYEAIKTNDQSIDGIKLISCIFAPWMLFVLCVVIYPASRGRVWAVRILRPLSYVGLAFYAMAVLGDLALFAFDGAYYRFLWGFAFLFPLAPLAIAAWFLIRGLRHEPWFNPDATLEDIGPSRGTIGDYDIQAGLDEDGNLPPEQLTATLADPAPPPRWLCYAAPPIAAARMKRWWYVALFTPVCLAALILAAFIPLRAIVVYGLMGSFADRLRSIQAYRKSVAATQEPDKQGTK